jgi:hypothetical protein
MPKAASPDEGFVILGIYDNMWSLLCNAQYNYDNTVMVFKIKIIGHEIKDDKVSYTIQVTNESTGDEKTFKYRYSQLKDIHDELEKLLSKLKLPIILP